ncbi:hypothetical protein C8R43DRAFT_1136429 [Mycena crocata]|nr:hypothetical protein C8R43DRAFT_1136429 [Mycena crocata]
MDNRSPRTSKRFLLILAISPSDYYSTMLSIQELSYDFPVASTSASTSSYSAQSQRTKRATSPRRTMKPRLPPVPRWELSALNDDELDLEEEERDYAALGYPGRRAPSPHVYPYTSATSAYSGYPYTSTDTGYTYGYSTPSPTYDYGVPMQLARSCDSASSALSSCSSSLSHSESRQGRCAKKIRKQHPRSVSPPACESYPSYPYTTSPTSSPAFSPYSSPYSADDLELEHSDDASAVVEEEKPEREHEPRTMVLKKQWVALSLRVQFGVFRAKRRLRDRVMSL